MLALLLLLQALIVTAIPTFDGLSGRFSMGSLVPGATYISALGPVRDNDHYTRHLSAQIPGQPGNLTVLPNPRTPPLFFINQNQLWQFNNESTIYPVNIVNTTGTADFPLQLVLGRKRTSSNGSWRWRGTMLYYDQGTQGNSGLFYTCPTPDGSSGVFMFLTPSPTPSECDALTLHSFNRDTTRGNR